MSGMLKPWCLFRYLLEESSDVAFLDILVWDVLSKELCLRYIPFFPGFLVTLYGHLMSAGLEESTDVINTIYHIVTVDSFAHHLPLLDGHHPAEALVQKKDNAKSILLKLFKSTLLEVCVFTVWPA